MPSKAHIIAAIVLALLLAIGLWVAKDQAADHRAKGFRDRYAPSPGPAPAAAPTNASAATASGPGATAPAAAASTPAAAADAASPWTAHNLADDAGRQAWSDAVRARALADRPAADSVAAKADMAARGDVDNGTGAYQFVAVRDGRVYVRATRNENAAISAAADLVRLPPYSLSGTGLTVAVWDAGSVRVTHQEFAGRLILRDSVAAHYHSTHVGGTVAGAGVTASAKGMAPFARLDSYDWNFDTSEMILAGMATPGQAGKLQLSNHSYGFQAGWYQNVWYGTWGARESDNFGQYDYYAAEQDAICYNAPYYLPFKAAGNDRYDSAPSAGSTFTYFDAQGSHVKSYDPATDPYSDNWDDGGYDTISLEGNAKNVLTVGAVDDAVSGGVRSLAAATMSGFSSWGPSDDGRVKPDLVANGVNLNSAGVFSDSAYTLLSGTSMATPSAMGAAALVVQRHAQHFSGQFMRSSLLKGLLIHTADDLGAPGPDYKFGWGLINARAAVEQLDAHAAATNGLRLVTDTLDAAQLERVYRFQWDRTNAIRATLCWTDPPGPTRTGLDNRAPVLINDLDLRVIAPDGATNFPFVLSPTNPAAPAVTGDNGADNVEQVLIAAPAQPGEFAVRVNIGQAPSGGAQTFALLLSGATQPPGIAHTPLVNTTNNATPYVVEAQISSEAALMPDSLRLRWNTQTPADPFNSVPLTNVAGNVYRGEIPAQTQGARVNYYLEAAATDGIASTAPAHAPPAVFSFGIVPAVLLVVSGNPTFVPGVVPDYGVMSFASGVTVRATAPLYSPPVDGARDMCVGWTGCCSVPAAGSTNAVEFVIHANAFLAWEWRTAYGLAQTASITGVVEATTWWLGGTTGRTETVPAVRVNDGTNYHFASWYVDGARMPDATNRATNPAEGVLMQGPREALALYLPAAQDGDADNVEDWWELYYFGGTNAPLAVDSDGDGFSNLKEFQDNTDPLSDVSVPAPPAIAHTPLASPQWQPAPWVIGATVADNDRVDRVVLEWQRNSGDWHSATLGAAQVSGVYTGAIPGPGVTGDAFVYRLLARDSAGLQAANGPYAVSAAYPVAALAPDDLGLIALPANTSTQLLLNVANTGHAALTWTLHALPAGLQDNVEAGTNGWTHGGPLDPWHIAPWRTFSGSNAWYMGGDASRQYPDSVKAWLMSPPVLVGSNATFTFRHWLKTEALKDATHAWDGGIVEISTNGGQTFTQIAPVGGYPYLIYGHSASAFPDNTPCYSGNVNWQLAQFDLAAYAGQSVRLRLTFGADGFVVNEGWYVDDLAVTPYGGAMDWLSTGTTTGVTIAQGAVGVPVFMRTHTLAPGETRRAVLVAETDDPAQPAHAVPVALHNSTREVRVEVTGAGSVSPPGPVWIETGASAAFTIQAEPYHMVADIRTNGGPVAAGFGMSATNYTWANVSVAGTGILQVAFAPTLTTNGVPVPWLVAYGLTNGAPSDEALADQDADRMPAWAEYIAGTDPTSATSRLAILTVQASALQWSSVSGRLYTVEFGAAGPADYAPLASNLPATPPLNSYTGAVATQGFYRVRVTSP